MLGGHELPLFWAVLVGLLVIDNCVLVPAGGDCLRFGRSWRLRYDTGARLEIARRDLVLLNPLNPFDRAAITARSIGPLGLPAFRESARRLRDGQRGANLLSWIGCVYLVVLALLALASLKVYFGVVLAVLALAHLLLWSASLVVLLRHRARLGLGGGRVASLVIEALFVPGYLVNLGKRVWFKCSFDLPALTVGLRQLGRLRDESARELHRLKLRRRLDDIEQSTEPGTAARQWIEEARQCLTTSALAAGS